MSTGTEEGTRKTSESTPGGKTQLVTSFLDKLQNSSWIAVTRQFNAGAVGEVLAAAPLPRGPTQPDPNESPRKVF